MGREERAAIFRDTELCCKNNRKLAESVKASAKRQLLILEGEPIPGGRSKKQEEKAEIIVSRKRTFEAAEEYREEKVCVLNFASASNPGGGVLNGAGAQEEGLCRCSTLYFNLNVEEMWEGFYSPHRKQKNPLHNDDCIYTPDVVVFKTDTGTPVLREEKEWFKVNVISCAAPNLRPRPANRMNPGDGEEALKIEDAELFNLHEKRLRRILDIAAAKGNEVIILGAFGCGAFQNNPEVVAKAAQKVVRDYLYIFKIIEFAIYCPPGSERNRQIFEEAILV